MTIRVNKTFHFSGHRDGIYALSRAASNDHFYTGGSDGFVVQWNSKEQADGVLLVKVPAPVYCLAFLPEKNILLIGTGTGNLHLVNLETGLETRNIKSHLSGLFDIKIHQGKIYTSGGDGSVFIYSAETFELENHIKVSGKSCRIISLSEQYLAVGSSDHHIHLFDIEDHRLVKAMNGHSNSVFSLAFHLQNKYMLSGGRDAMLKVWDIKNLKLLKDIPAHLLHINQVVFSPSGKLFATVSMDKTIKLWDSDSISLIKVIDKEKNDGHTSSVNKLLWLSEEDFVTVSDDKTAMIWQIE